MNEPLLERFNDVLTWLKELGTEPVSEEEIPDVAGLLNQIRAQAQELSVNLRAEAAPYAQGEIYRLVPNPSTKYSYNIPGILARRMANDPAMTLNTVALELLQEDVFGAPNWRKLQKWAQTHDVTLTVAEHEITEGDGDAQVGRYSIPGPHKIEAIEKVD